MGWGVKLGGDGGDIYAVKKRFCCFLLMTIYRQGSPLHLPPKSLLSTAGFKYLEATNHVLPNRHHPPRVIELPAVAWCREHSNETTVGEKLVTILNDLVGTDYEIEVVTIQELEVGGVGRGALALSLVWYYVYTVFPVLGCFLLLLLLAPCSSSFSHLGKYVWSEAV